MSRARPLTVAGRAIGDGVLPAIIVPLVGRTPQAIAAELAVIVPKRPHMLEWRIDYFEGIAEPARVIETALAIRQAAAGIPVLLTRRHVREGGQAITIDEPAVVSMIAAACEARCIEAIDYEMSNAGDDIARLRRISRDAGITMILSTHDFQETPPATVLEARFGRAQQLGADVAKVAVMPRDAEDVLTLLAASHRASRALSIPLISMSMGGLGSASRMIGWMYGSAATFAVGESASAPGQIPFDELVAALDIVRRARGADGG